MSLTEVILRYKFVILFYGLLILFIYIFRKKFDKEGKFVFLYRTKYGLKMMEYLAVKCRWFYRIFGTIGAWASFPGIAGITFFMFYGLVDSFFKPAKILVAPVFPGIPIAGQGITFPLITGWICLFVIIIIHESAHGIIARLHKIKIKSSGIAFFGPILAAFVEPDEKQLAKQKVKKQIQVFAAGPFSNLVTSAIFFLALSFLVMPAFLGNSIHSVILVPQKGMPAEMAGMKSEITLIGVDDIKVESLGDFFNYTDSLKPNQTVELYAENGSKFTITTISHSDNESKGRLGVIGAEVYTPKNESFFNKITFYILKWLSTFLFWLSFISFSIGLINLFPIYITDGAKILELTLVAKMKKKETAVKIWKFINSMCLLLLFMLFLLPLLRKALGL